MSTKKKKAKPVMLVARDYVVFADGTRYEKGDPIPPGVDLPDSFVEEK